MAESNTQTAAVEKIRSILAEATGPSIPGLPTFAKHGAFDDLQARLQFLQLGAEALTGLGSMMQPERESSIYQMNMTRVIEAGAVFRFFGEALRDPAEGALYDMERLQRAARGEAA